MKTMYDLAIKNVEGGCVSFGNIFDVEGDLPRKEDEYSITDDRGKERVYQVDAVKHRLIRVETSPTFLRADSKKPLVRLVRVQS